MENVSSNVFHSALFDEEYRIDLIPPAGIEEMKDNDFVTSDPPAPASSFSSLEGMDSLSLNVGVSYSSDLLTPYSLPGAAEPFSFEREEDQEFCMVESEMRSQLSKVPNERTKHRRQKSQIVDPDYSMLSGSEYQEESLPVSSKVETKKQQNRLERNRASARESRRRKKEYYDRLAIRAKRLEDEIQFYKAELDRTQHSHKKSEFGSWLEPIRLAQASSEKSDLEQALEQMWRKLGGVSAEHQRDSCCLLEQLLERLFPEIMKYFLYMAVRKNGVFREVSGVKGGAKSDTQAEALSREKFRRLLDISKEDYQQVRALGEAIRGSAERIKEQVDKLWKTQKDLMEEMKNLEKLLKEKIYSKISGAGAINLASVIESDHVDVSKFVRDFLGFQSIEHLHDIPLISTILTKSTLASTKEARTRKRPKILEEYES